MQWAQVLVFADASREGVARVLTARQAWPAPGFVDTKFRCLMKSEGRSWRRRESYTAENTSLRRCGW
jgi:hypothetical protein